MNVTRIRSVIVVALVALLACNRGVNAQVVVGPEIWRAFTERLEPGKMLKIRLRNGQRFKATLLKVSADAMMILPKTRAAVPPQLVRFTEVETLEVDTGRGIGVGKAAAVGAAVAAGTFLALMALAFAVWGD